MQALLLLQPRSAAAFHPPLPRRGRKTLTLTLTLTLIPSTTSPTATATATALSHFPPSPSPSQLLALITARNRNRSRSWNRTPPHAAAASSPAADDESERAKLAQVSKRLENTSRYFKRLGSLGFWGQLVCTVVSAVILSFSTLVTGKVTSPITFYTTAGSIAAAFVSVFWSFGYIRLSERLKRTANEPAKAPPRADVVKSLKNGIVVNLLGMGAAVLGMQATVGLLVAKALTTSAVPYYQGIPPGRSPVLALDVFLVQASANTILSHFLGLVCSLELLRSVTLPAPEAVAIPKAV
ncbi:protein TIC 21, chloroplastic [Ananas comosus]|uniref:Protein TIC 21, chloroplastic n=1 Tax=Ananas comosus TaxID=4615 RepID=A0A6P5FZ05_ANACO|nr:protein TIC 21, chloroplastic [Ananas comosus]